MSRRITQRELRNDSGRIMRALDQGSAKVLITLLHAADDSIGLEYEIATRRRRDRGRIVGEPKGAGMFGKWLEIARDETLLAGLRCAVSAHRDPPPK